jgi:hypothetical protein
VNSEPQEESASSYEQRPEDQKHDEDGHLQLQMFSIGLVVDNVTPRQACPLGWLSG